LLRFLFGKGGTLTFYHVYPDKVGKTHTAKPVRQDDRAGRQSEEGAADAPNADAALSGGHASVSAP